MDKIWLSSPHMGGTELKYINEAYENNWVAPLGPNVNGFEADIQNFLNIPNAAALSSGTAAIHLALIMLNVSYGDEVICQSFTFSATANPIIYQGATPIFIDSDEDTWNMSPSFLRQAIVERVAKGKKPKAIIVVHLYGMPAKMNEILAIADEFNIPVVEDAAEALGSSYFGKKCGTLGKFGVLSFNGNKIITTSGGGALVSYDETSIKKVRFLATQARDQAPHYQHSQIGYNYRMSNICAGIGRGQMEVLDQRILQRRANNKKYAEFFKDIPGITLQVEPDDNFYSNFWLTAILMDSSKTDGVTREDIRLAMENENIESRPLWKPMHLQPVFSGAKFFGDGFCERLFNKGLCLPSGSNLEKESFNRIFEIFHRLL